MKKGYVYLLANKVNTVIYIGVTSNLAKRIWEHKKKLVEGFTKKYNVDKLVYYEIFELVVDAIKREKQIKGWVRKKKVDLVESLNPNWNDLYKNLNE